MTSVIVVNEEFERTWSFAAEHARGRWADSTVHFVRLEPGDSRSIARLELPKDTTRLLSLGVRPGGDLGELPDLREVGLALGRRTEDPDVASLTERGVAVYQHRNEGFWGQSVAEFGLGLTIAALRRIPQTYHAMLTDHSVWEYRPPAGQGRSGARSDQFGDDPAFASGTIAGKRVRVVGMGNIGARYASFCAMLGAGVAGWDAVAADPVFHRTGTRRLSRLTDLVTDAEILAPMLPLVPATEGLITAELINALPTGCLVVCVTRMQICDTGALRRRVLANEISLAADVFDIEPLPFDDPLLRHPHVTHTPHNAGRTIHANQQYADALIDQFESQS